MVLPQSWQHFYRFLARLPVVKYSYPAKFLLVAFTGICIPLLVIIIFLLVQTSWPLGQRLWLLLVVVLATVVATAVSLSLLQLLLQPITLIGDMLQRYLDSGQLPETTDLTPDEAGKLMAQVRYTVEYLDRSLQELRIQAEQDGLTGVLNRRAAETVLAQDMARVTRERRQLFVGLLDIDSFKHLNDTYGYPFGDRCLRHLVDIVNNCTRAGDWIARWGGDEFLIVLWQPEGDSCRTIFRRIRSALHYTPVVASDGTPLHLHTSIGACQYRPGLEMEYLIESVDEALHHAKRSGGNTLVFADPEPWRDPSPEANE